MVTPMVAVCCCLLKTWFSTSLNQLKAVAEDAFSSTTPLRTDAPAVVTSYTTYLTSYESIAPDAELQLPLSREMALYVI